MSTALSKAEHSMKSTVSVIKKAFESLKKKSNLKITDFKKRNSASMTALNFNLTLDDFLVSIQSKGFAIGKVYKLSIPSKLRVRNAKIKFRKRTDRANVFDKVLDGELVSERAGEFILAFRQQTVDNLYKEKVNPLFKKGLKRIQQ